MSPASERKRRNVNPAVTSAKCRLAALVSVGASPDRIEAARGALRTAKARALVVRDLLPLPDAERMELAALLLTGAGDDAA